MRYSGVRNWKADLSRVVLGGIGSVVGLSIADWPDNAAEAAWTGLAGLIAGLAVAFFAEYVVRLHLEVQRLQDVERELQADKAQRAEERRLSDKRLVITSREAAINAVDVEVWGGAYNEALATGNFLPLDAILARRDVLIKAKNLHLPPS